MKSTGTFGMMIVLAVLSFAAAGCGGEQGAMAPEGTQAGPGPAASAPPHAAPPGETLVARAVLESKETDLTGTATFTQEGFKVRVKVEVSGATPGPHGIAVHEYGECGDDYRLSAGAHLNPDGAAHGCPGMREYHPGDLGNVEVGEDGTGTYEAETTVLTVTPGSNSVVGRSFILRATRDDCVSRPMGNAGDFIACGVIEAVEEGGEEEGAAMDEETAMEGEGGGEAAAGESGTG